MTITICVCGAGTMGCGIAQVTTQSGFDTILFDIDDSALERAIEQIEKNIDYLEQKGKITSIEKVAILERLQTTTDLEDCTAEIIIEAIAENADEKIELFNELSKYNNEEVIFASNTSSLSITRLQEKINVPERVVGMHFFNPPYIMKLVEIVKGKHTSEEVAEALYETSIQLGKVPVFCKDTPGFIVNRVARQYYLESLKIMETGIASFEQIDSILEATGFKMGPFRLMDLIGIDINLAVSNSLYKAFNHEGRFAPSPIQTAMVEKGRLGKKTGKGFYNY
jgi:3-hydroxybutyryl-CoA dehydrogenase